MKNVKTKLLLIFILIIASFFRFYNLNWDGSTHVHPDERFLTMVGVAMKVPSSLVQYLNPQTSLMNPANISFNFYVYGLLPLSINKIIAVWMGSDTYNLYTIQGRFLSAISDLIIVVLIFLVCRLLENRHRLDKNVKFYAAFFYSIAVLPIQLSHFFAVDTFVNMFVFASLYFSLRYFTYHSIRNLFTSAALAGLALACKISAIYVFPIIGFLLGLGLINHFFKPKELVKSFYIIILGGLYVLITYLFTRLADPYLFQTSNFLDPKISKLFLSNLAELQGWANPQAMYPPGVQWVHKTPIIFALNNIIFYGVGIPYFIMFILGIFWTFWKRQVKLLYIPAIWAILFFFYQSLQYFDTMRYFIFLYPFMAIFAGVALNAISNLNRAGKYLSCVIIILVIIWPLAFLSIYTKPLTRVTASEWIFKNVPNTKDVLFEAWDDPLPLPLIPVTYSGNSLPVFDPDTPTKWNTMNQILAKGDYLFLSSNRGWASIPTVPERYPQMKKFYNDLFAGKLEYKQVIKFSSYPSLRYLGIPLDFPDKSAEEAFTVYDHPEVIIFKNTNK